MGSLIYSAICSLDGYTVDTAGSFAWAAPDEEVHAFVNELERPIGTYLYGRRMYEVMRFWETAEGDDEPVSADYARIWRQADKIVFSSTLDDVDTERTELRRAFDAGEVAALVADSPTDVAIGGPTLAGAALDAGIVDQVLLLVQPVAVGGGTAALQVSDHLRLDLVDERRFASGVVLLRYAVS